MGIETYVLSKRTRARPTGNCLEGCGAPAFTSLETRSEKTRFEFLGLGWGERLGFMNRVMKPAEVLSQELEQNTQNGDR
jgi:hypothetical protein